MTLDDMPEVLTVPEVATVLRISRGTACGRSAHYIPLATLAAGVIVFAWMVRSPNRQGLHDLAAGVVVRQTRPHRDATT